MIIDINMHVLPEFLFKDEAVLESYLRIVPRAYGEFASVRDLPGGRPGQKQIAIEMPRGYENLNFSDFNFDSVARIKIMDEAGLDKAILRTPCWQEWLTLEMCKQFNDSMYKVVQEHPDRLMGVAAVPPWGDKGCLGEADRCINKLGFVGVELAAHYGTLYLDDQAFRPYFRHLNELGVPVVVHHTPLPVDYQSIYEQTNVRRLIGRNVDQLTAVSREIFSNLFEECPNLKLIHTHLGGGVFAFTSQIAPRKSTFKEEVQRFDQKTAEVRKCLNDNLFFDITSPTAWSKPQLECAIKELGAEHVLYSSSYPVRLDWVLGGVEYVRGLNISNAEKELIFCGNASRLFKIPVAESASLAHK
jgi:predicted TIM-barrel fold metal-dependent hydrolase